MMALTSLTPGMEVRVVSVMKGGVFGVTHMDGRVVGRERNASNTADVLRVACTWPYGGPERSMLFGIDGATIGSIREWRLQS